MTVDVVDVSGADLGAIRLRVEQAITKLNDNGAFVSAAVSVHDGSAILLLTASREKTIPSPAEEIEKLKALYDSSAINGIEYDRAKTALLRQLEK